MKEFDYFEHEADIGIIGRGKTVADALIAAAKAVFAYMTNLEHVQTVKTVSIQFVEQDVELALVEWLNLLIAEARNNAMIFSSFSLRQEEDTWIGTARGQSWKDNLERGVEVKGATLTMLSVKHFPQFYEARCVVDV